MTSQHLTLWLLRHAKAVADPPSGGEDFDRVLAPRGRRDGAALGNLIGQRGKGHYVERRIMWSAERTSWQWRCAA